MSRGFGKKSPYKTITVHVDEDMAYEIDQRMTYFGIESKGAALLALARAGAAQIPMDAYVLEMQLQSQKEMRRREEVALAEFYDERSRLFKS